jgi:hypothetical protein
VLSSSKVLAGSLAAATSAVAGSYFGVLGTVGGAAAGSVVSAVSSEIYQRSIERTAGRLRRTNRAVPTPGRGAQPEAPAPPPSRGLSVGSIVFGSILIFALGIAAVTGVEYVTGKPISGGSGGTTLSHLAHLDAGSALGDLLGGSGSDDSDRGGGLLGGLLGG